MRTEVIISMCAEDSLGFYEEKQLSGLMSVPQGAKGLWPGEFTERMAYDHP